jgi:hypothetical protein
MLERNSVKDSLTRIVNSFTYPNEKWLEGQLLTIIDASISNERQNKHLKDLIRSTFDQYRYDKRLNFKNCFEKIELSILKDKYEDSNDGFTSKEALLDLQYINEVTTSRNCEEPKK